MEIRKPTIILQPGQSGTYSGFPARVSRHYDGNMYEITVPGGLTCVDAHDFIPDPEIVEKGKRISGQIGRHDWAIGETCEDGVPVFVDDRQLSYRKDVGAAKAYAHEIIARLQADGDYRLNDRPAGFLPPSLPQKGAEMAQHSPAPFTLEAREADDEGFIHDISDANGRLIAKVYCAEGAGEEENMANALLLAASPKLLAALKLVVEYHVPKVNPLSDAAILSAVGAIALVEKASIKPAAAQSSVAALCSQQERIADDALASYDFGEGVTVVGLGSWERATFDGKDDWTKVVYFESDDGAPGDSSQRASFHAAFVKGTPTLSEAYAYCCNSGAEIGSPSVAIESPGKVKKPKSASLGM